MFYIIYFFLYLFSLLPFFILYGLSNVVCFLLYHVFKYRREVVMQNLATAFPGKSVLEITIIAKQFYLHLTDSFVETVKMLSLSKKAFLRRVKMDTAVSAKLQSGGKSITYYLGHQFSWEYGNWITGIQSPVTFIVVYLELTNAAMEKIFLKIRGRMGTELLSAYHLPAKMKALASRQYSIALAADQSPGNPSSAYWLNFFGKATPFASGAEKSAQRSGNAVIFINIVKTGRGKYRFEESLVTENASELKSGELTKRYRDFLEQCINEQPSNYLWSHRRWKTPYTAQFKKRWIDDVPAPLSKNIN